MNANVSEGVQLLSSVQKYSDTSDIAVSNFSKVLGRQPISSNKGLLVTPMHMPVQSLRMEPIGEAQPKCSGKYSWLRRKLFQDYCLGWER